MTQRVEQRPAIASTASQVSSQSPSHGTTSQTNTPQQHQPVSPPAREAAASQDPRELWQQLLESVRNRPALGWMKSLDFDSLQGQVVHLIIKPGQREMVRFFGERQRGQLAQMLSELAGRTLKVELKQVGRELLDDSTQGGQGGQGNQGNGAGQSGQPSQAGGQSGSGRGAITTAQRQAVMGLPLVRELMEAFDLSLVEVRQQTPDVPEVSEDELGENNDDASDTSMDQNDFDEPDEPDEFDGRDD